MHTFRAIIAALLLVLVPAQAFAAVCVTIASGSISFGDALIEVAGGGGAFFNLVGEMRRADCFDSTTFTGSAHITALGRVHLGLLVTGSPTCYPITVWGDLPLTLSGPGHVDLPSGGLSSFTNVTISQIPCFAPDAPERAPSQGGFSKPGSGE